MSFWLAYFDFFTIRGRQLLDERSGEEQVALARDVYTYLHLPMVVGIVLFAFAVKATLKHLGDELGAIEALALCGGPAFYLFAYVALRFRVSRTVRGGRLLAAVACALLIPAAMVMPALAALALVAGVFVALHAYELIWWHAERTEVRAARFPASP
jgi:low temperature requirement protein LtrA